MQSEKQYQLFYGMLIYLTLFVFIWLLAFFDTFPIFIAMNGNRGGFSSLCPSLPPSVSFNRSDCHSARTAVIQ